MSHINVTINGRQYRMACEEGQEARLLKLAESVESRIGHPSSRARGTLRKFSPPAPFRPLSRSDGGYTE